VVYSSNFLPLVTCGRSKCAENNKKGNLRMYFEASKYVDFQEITLLEPSTEVPSGNVPKSIRVIL